MRAVVSFLIGLLTIATVVALGIMARQNTRREQLALLGATLHVGAGLVVTAATGGNEGAYTPRDRATVTRSLTVLANWHLLPAG